MFPLAPLLAALSATLAPDSAVREPERAPRRAFQTPGFSVEWASPRATPTAASFIFGGTSEQTSTHHLGQVTYTGLIVAGIELDLAPY